MNEEDQQLISAVGRIAESESCSRKADRMARIKLIAASMTKAHFAKTPQELTMLITELINKLDQK